MDWLNLIGTAVALAMDAFAVAFAVAASLMPLSRRQTFRLTWHFGLFQAVMPCIGWAGSLTLAGVLSAVDHWIAFGLLWILGLRMIRQAGASKDGLPGADPTRGWSLVGLSVATSVDALAVGFSLGLLGIRIWIPAMVIGTIASVLTYVGTFLGSRVGPFLGQWAGRAGGVILMIIGARILLQHLIGAP